MSDPKEVGSPEHFINGFSICLPIKNAVTKNELTVTLAQPKTKRDIRIRFPIFHDGLDFHCEFLQHHDLNYFVVIEE